MATKSRSPNYPAIDLNRAIDFARKLYAANHLHKASAEVVAKAIGYTGLNGSSLTAIAALKKYGLLEEEGKEFRISKDALTILVEPASSEERARTIVKLASKPDLFAELQSNYPGSVPSDEILRAWFLRKGFVQSTVDTPIRAYRETMELSYAQQALYNAVPPAPPAVQTPKPVVAPKVGDLVQWESAGTLMFEQPRRVVSVTPDEQFLFVEGSATGIPTKEITATQAATATQALAPVLPPILSSPNSLIALSGMRQDTFTIDEGTVLLQCPAVMSAASYEDFNDWIELQLRKIKRSISQ